MSAIHPATPPQQGDRKGLLAVIGGVALAAGTLLLSTACCWAPALILSLGLGSAFAVFLGAKWYLVAVGAGLAVVGLGWQLRRQKGDPDCCAPASASGS